MKQIILGCILISALSGCGIFTPEPYIPTNYYDIGFPQKLRGNIDYRFDTISFQAMGPYHARMVFRRNSNMLAFGEYNRWSVPPVQMLERYFTLAYDSDIENIPKNRQYNLKGELFQLEADLETKKVNLVLALTVTQNDGGALVFHKIFTESTAVNNVTGDSFASATQTMINKIITTLDKKMQ